MVGTSHLYLVAIYNGKQVSLEVCEGIWWKGEQGNRDGISKEAN